MKELKITKKSVKLSNGFEVIATAKRGYEYIDNNLDGHIVKTKSVYIDTTTLTVIDENGKVKVSDETLRVLENTNKFMAAEMKAGAVAEIGSLADRVLLGKESYSIINALIKDVSDQADTEETIKIREEIKKSEKDEEQAEIDSIKFAKWLSKQS